MLTVHVVGDGVVSGCEGGAEGVGGVAAREGPQYLLYALNINQAVIAITRMAAAVKVDDGMWKLKNDQELSMLVLVLILSATSVTD